jgi:insulysin
MKEGWAMGLSCGADHELSVFSDFCVTIDLTEKGLENYEKVAEAVFKYAQNIAAAGPQEFVFNETSTLGKIKFDFSDKGSAINYCMNLACTMPRFESPEDVPHLLRHRYVADVFDTERTK